MSDDTPRDPHTMSGTPAAPNAANAANPVAQDPAQPPRNVPLLTEVLAAPEAEAADATAAEAGPPPAGPSHAAATQVLLDASTDALLARLGPQLEQDIAEAIGRVLHEQMLGFNARVRKAVAEVVRENVAKAAMRGPD